MENFLYPQQIKWTGKQLDVLDSEPNLIITGCPGSGKTLLAINLSIILAEKGEKVALIVFTKALRTFIQDCLKRASKTIIDVYYEREWDREIFKFYDIIVLDEFQDFSIEDIFRLKSYSSKGMYLFGDSEQKLYRKNLRNESNLSDQELVNATKFQFKRLDKNFRIPIKIVELVTSIYHKIGTSSETKTSVYSPKNIIPSEQVGVIPEILHLENHVDQMNWMVNFLKQNSSFHNIGILFKLNDQQRNGYFIDHSVNIEQLPGILETYEFLTENGIKCGYKHRSNDNLSFINERNINLLTIHSSKGLEFDCVIIPFYSFSNMNVNPSLPYVAFTRSSQKLIMLYSGIISEDLEFTNNTYLNGEIRKRTKNDRINLKWIIEKDRFQTEYNEYHRLRRELDNFY